MVESVFRIMKSSFEAKARAYEWHLSYVQVYLRKRKTLLGVIEQEIARSSQSLYRRNESSGVQHQSKSEMKILRVLIHTAPRSLDTNRKRHLRKTEPTGAVPLHQSMFRSKGDHGIVNPEFL